MGAIFGDGRRIKKRVLQKGNRFFLTEESVFIFGGAPLPGDNDGDSYRVHWFGFRNSLEKDSTPIFK